MEWWSDEAATGATASLSDSCILAHDLWSVTRACGPAPGFLTDQGPGLEPGPGPVTGRES